MKKTILLLHLMIFLGLTSGCPAMCRCTRFKTFCRDSRIKALPSRLPATTQHLSMEGDALPVLESTTFRTSDFSRLTTLHLTNMHIRNITASAFRNISKLESLRITRNNIPVLEPHVFIVLDKLFALDLSQNNLTFIRPGAFEGLKALRHLNLSKNAISTVQLGMFNGLSRDLISQTPSTLDLSINRFTKVDEGAFRGLCSFTELTISFSFSPLESPPDLFEGLRGLNKMTIDISGWFPYATMRQLPNLKHVCLNVVHLPKIPNKFLADSSLLRALSITQSKVRDLEFGCFYGLRSLLELDLSYNEITHIDKATFEDLDSLKELKLSRNDFLTLIDDNAFIGLRSLRFLDLTPNQIFSISENTLAGLPLLRDLILSNSVVGSVHPQSFSKLHSLKRLQMVYQLPGDSFDVRLDRLDSYQGPGHVLSDGLQVMKTINLTVANGEVFENVRKWLRHVEFLRHPMNVQVYKDITPSYSDPLSKFEISSLQLNNVRLLKNNSLRAFPKLESLIIKSLFSLTIEEGAFDNVLNLKNIKLQSHSAVHLETGVFRRLQNLQYLNIQGAIGFSADGLFITPRKFVGLHKLKELRIHRMKLQYLRPDIFSELRNLQILNLHTNRISQLYPGAFQGLEPIDTIVLSHNKISEISDGVFGAICDDNFTLSCFNISRLSTYCNTSSVLKTLTHLVLDYNDISSIHPRAFLGCLQLRTLSLSRNKLQALNFLYTPKLRVLTIEYANISQISNTSFSCTPKLSTIDLKQSSIKDLQVSAFYPLKYVEIVDFPLHACDCEAHAFWQWLRKRRIRYIDWGLCGHQHIDVILSELQCNSTLINYGRTANKTAASHQYVYFAHYIEPIVFIFIFLSGCFGNGLLLFIILRHSDLRDEKQVCVAHLAAIDICSITLNLPLSYWDVVHGTWDLGETTCKLFLLSKDLTVALVVFTVLALSFERYLVVFTSFQLKVASGFKCRPILSLTAVWIFALVSSIFSYSNATLHDRCLSSPPDNEWQMQRTLTFQLLMHCLVPVSSIAFLNIYTAYIIKTSINKWPGEIRNEFRAKNRNIVASIVLILSVVFVLSYLPNFLLRTLVSWGVFKNEEVFWYSFVTYCLFFLHTIFNPFAIFVMGSKYKSHIRNYTKCFTREIRDTSANAGHNHEAEIPRVLSDTEAKDIEVRMVRQERLKRLQTRFM